MAKKLDILLAIGGPKSRNPSGVSDSSISAPDQGGDALAPGGGTMEDEPMEEMEEEVESETPSNAIQLPPGFKPPSGSENGIVTTTIRGKIMDGMFYPEAIGDMPLKSSAPPEEVAVEEETVEPIEEESPYPEAEEFERRRKDEKSAKSAFQPGR